MWKNYVNVACQT